MDVSSPAAPATRGREVTRERLVESATSLFATRGLHAITTHDIAAGAGVAAGTFYLHFKDKHALFREIVWSAVASLHARLDRAHAAAADPADAVRRRSAEVIGFAEENRDLIRILFGRDTGVAAVEHEVLAHLAGEVETTLRARIAAGAVRRDVDPAVAAQAIVGMLARVVAWWAEDPSRAAREAVIHTLAEIQLSGLHSPGAAAPVERKR
jgi:AcrR family transcriptional regulator